MNIYFHFTNYIKPTIVEISKKYISRMNSRYCVSIVLFLVKYNCYHRISIVESVKIIPIQCLNAHAMMFDFRDDLQAWCETPGWILDLDINAFVTFSVNGFDWRLFAPFWSLTWYHYINEGDCLIILQKLVCNPIISKILIWNELQAEPFWVCLVRHLSKKYKKYIIKDFICLHKKTFDIKK